jgi:hypothetical protein
LFTCFSNVSLGGSERNQGRLGGHCQGGSLYDPLFSGVLDNHGRWFAAIGEYKLMKVMDIQKTSDFQLAKVSSHIRR